MKYKPVNKKIRWHDLFTKDMAAWVRKERWEEWKAKAVEGDDEQGKEMVDYWAKDNIDETCAGCIHRDNDWCKYAELPCNVNPVLTLQNGIIGMACCGVGYQASMKQGELF
jgi:hypothetical protein